MSWYDHGIVMHDSAPNIKTVTHDTFDCAHDDQWRRLTDTEAANIKSSPCKIIPEVSKIDETLLTIDNYVDSGLILSAEEDETPLRIAKKCENCPPTKSLISAHDQ